MVRLKDSTKTLRKEQLIKFQFHMVRLKVHQLHDVRLHELISIPHGTIKSGVVITALYEVAKFQFHMVRLKVPQREWGEADDQISIPHGTIKRFDGLHRLFDFPHFNSTWYD